MAEADSTLLGQAIVASRSLGGGCLFDVRAVDLADGQRVVVKEGGRGLPGQLRLEARMLADLSAAGAPAPEVLTVDDHRLVLAWIDNDGGGLDAVGRRTLVEELAALHAQVQPAFGYDYDTVIGALPQPNPPTPSWIAFFRAHRLLGPAAAATAAGVLDAPLANRLEALATRLDDLLDDTATPSLLHGDLWSGNVLTQAGRPVAWIDPALYRGHPEIELAFALLFGPLDRRAVADYGSLRSLAPGFEPTRCAIYQLYPLLTHLRLFGRSYAPAIRQRLDVIGL